MENWRKLSLNYCQIPSLSVPLCRTGKSHSWGWNFNQGLGEHCLRLKFRPLGEISLSYMDTHDGWILTIQSQKQHHHIKNSGSFLFPSNFILNFEQSGFTLLQSAQKMQGMANSVDPDHTAPALSGKIWNRLVTSDLSIQIHMTLPVLKYHATNSSVHKTANIRKRKPENLLW